MIKSTLKKKIKLNFLKSNFNFKERKVLFMILKLKNLKEVSEVFVISWKDGLTKSSQLLTTSQDLTLPLKELAVEPQLEIIWFNVRQTSMSNLLCQKSQITWTLLWKIQKVLKLIWENILICGRTDHKKDFLNFWNKIFPKLKLLKGNKKLRKKIFF
jgi:hypothetical protein